MKNRFLDLISYNLKLNYAKSINLQYVIMIKDPFFSF